MTLWTYRMSFFANWCGCVLERKPSLLPRILRALEEGHSESYIICPGAMVGTATGQSQPRRSFSISCRRSPLGSKRPSTSERARTSSIRYVVLPASPFLNPSRGSANNHIVILSGALGRPRRPLQPRPCAHTKPRGRQGEPVREILHRHQYPNVMEAHHDRV